MIWSSTLSAVSGWKVMPSASSSRRAAWRRQEGLPRLEAGALGGGIEGERHECLVLNGVGKGP